MKKFFKWLTISLSTIIIIIVIAVSLFFYFLSPARLTPIVNRFATEYLDAKVNFDSVKVSIFAEFPKLSVTLVGGEIISYALKNDTTEQNTNCTLEKPKENEHKLTQNKTCENSCDLCNLCSKNDTLVRFNELMISLNILDLLKSKVNIQRIRLVQPTINAFVSPSGKANWDIWTPPETTEDITPLDLNIDRFSIRGGTINYISRPDSMAVQATIGRLRLRGNITPNLEKLDIERFVCSKIKASVNLESRNINAALVLDTAAIEVVEKRKEYSIKIEGNASANVENQNYANELPLKLNGTFKLGAAALADPESNSHFGFRDFGLAVANLPEIKLNGDIILSKKGDINSDLNIKTDAMPLQSLLNLVPKGFSDEIPKINTNIKFDLNTSIKGTYKSNAKGKLPIVDVDIKIPKGSLTYNDSLAKIDNIALDASFHYNPISPKKTGVKIKKIDVNAFAVKLNGHAEATNLFNDPKVTLKLKGSANLREAMKFAPQDLGITARGDITFNIEGSFLASRLNQQDLAKNDLIVQINADRVRVRIPKDTISILVERTFAELNTTKTRTNRSGEVRRQLSFEFKSDTARVRMPSRETIALSKIDLSMRSSDAIVSGDTTGAVVRMSGHLEANTIEYSGIDSTTMRLREVKSNVRISPSRENRTLPSIRFDIEANRFSARAHNNRANVRDAKIEITATKIPPVVRTRRVTTEHQLDSLQKIYPNIQRDSLVAHSRTQRRANRQADDFASEDINIRDAELGATLRQWSVSGSIKSRSGRIVSPYFPLRTRIQNLDIAFTTNDITLQNLTIRSGESKLNITGKIDGISTALSRGRGLKIDADIKADTLNINELLVAAANGSAFAHSSEEHKRMLASAENEDQLEKMIEKANDNNEGATPLIVVPSNVEVDIKLNVKNGKYADITIDKLTGALVSRDRVLQLKDIVARTNVGQIDLTALYATRTKKDITFGIDLDFKNIQVEKFIEIIPSVDSLLPMLSSFRGIVSCQLAATASIDTTMNIIMPSLNAACRISGKNMVLLDGETFAEIAKTLRFRNRKENLVDSISVEMLVRNSQIEIFPFIMQIDRYRAAIGGTQNLDMSFKYHISALKSPIPFPVGINISGNFDKMKFSIGRARFKDINKQVYVTVIEDTRLNLRTEINNIIQQGVDRARFSQFVAPTIDPSLLDIEILTPQDSLKLYKEGLIDVAPSSITTEDQPQRRRRGQQ